MSRTLLVQDHCGSLQSRPIRERFQLLLSSAGRDFMRRLTGILLAILCLALGSGAAFAQGAYPNKTIRVLIPYAPGGLTDVVARYYGDHLRKVFGQNVLVENKPGASGIIAIEEMARAKPDGYTIMVGNISTNCLTPVLLAKRMRIDYDRDVQIIARLADTPVFFMATTTNFPPKTFGEFIDYAQAHPDDGRYASAGIGAYQHVNTEILAKRAGGLQMVHIRSRTAARASSRISPAATPTCPGSTSPTRS